MIELLVVMAIIAILLAILIPGLNVAKEQAASIPCSSNIRQLATAWYLYQQDFNGRFPGGDAWWHGANGVWYPWAEPPTGASAAGNPASLVSETGRDPAGLSVGLHREPEGLPLSSRHTIGIGVYRISKLFGRGRG